MPDPVSLAALLVVLSLCLSLLVFQGVTGVPPVSSNAAEAAEVVALLKQAGLTDRAVVYELGCGWGSLAIALAKAFPEADIRGIEISPFPYWVARFRTRGLANVSLKRGSYFDHDLTDAKAVTCYLMIKSMPKLASFLDQTLAPGTPVVSLSFWFRGRQVAAVRDGAGPLGAAALYYWPAHKNGAS